MDPSTLPHWAQSIFYVILASGTALTAVLSYRKKEVKKDPAAEATGSTSVISASFIDSKLLKELIEAIRDLQDDQGRDIKKLHRIAQDLAESLIDLNESTKNQIEVSRDLIRAANRSSYRD